MSSRDEVLTEDEGFFGPGTDLAISLAAILILVVSIRAQIDDKDNRRKLEIESILRNQARLVDAVAAYYGTAKQEREANVFGISLPDTPAQAGPDITIRNDATLQRISFGSHVLFGSDDIQLLPQGRAVLMALGKILREEIENIQEIHIQGHADPRPSKSYASNLELAARRAMTVYSTLQEAGIDPTRAIMSATSFGEYVPVQRRTADTTYSAARLRDDNNSPAKQRLNRRIEILLIYRRSD